MKAQNGGRGMSDEAVKLLVFKFHAFCPRVKFA